MSSSSNHEVVIAAVARTPFGRFGGALADLSAARLSVMAVDALLDRAGIPPELIDALYVGSGLMGSGAFTLARQVTLSSKLKDTTPSATVDRACCSGMSTIGIGWKDLRLGLADALICGGVDNLSAMPLFWPRRRSRQIGPVTVSDPLTLRAPGIEQPIAAYTSTEALALGIDRMQQDQWALQSHSRYFAAQENGYFNFERISVVAPQAKGEDFRIEQDESPRRDTSIEKLSRLKTIYDSETITAGNAPGLNDGAAFVLLVSRQFALSHGLPILARIVDYAQVADGPTSGSYTPAIAIAKLLKRAHMTAEQLKLLEINEAFAATPLVSTLRLANGDMSFAGHLREKTNPHGGAVAIGHPLGASGARITMTLVNGLRRLGGGYGAAAICGGFGQGDALLLEVEG